MSNYRNVLPSELLDLYEIHDVHHAAAILSVDFPDALHELTGALCQFRFREQWVTDPGGNESQFPKALASLLHPLDWQEAGLQAKLVVTEKRRHGISDTEIGSKTAENEQLEVVYGTHHIDFVKGKVALDFEWNSKDQTFDRDLYAFRAFFEYGKIDVGLIVTRSNDLDSYFAALGTYTDKHGDRRKYKDKFGASTTHMAKLLPRIDAGRQGGCPLLVLGITRRLLGT